MRICIGSNKKNTLEKAFASVIYQAFSEAGCEVLLVVDEFDDAWEFLHYVAEMHHVENDCCNAWQLSVMFENGSTACAIDLHHLDERTIWKARTGNRRYINFLLDFFIRIDYDSLPLIDMLNFDDMQVFHYCTITTPDECPDDIVELECDYGKFRSKWNVMGILDVIRIVNMMYDVCRDNTYKKGNYLFIDEDSSMKYCDGCSCGSWQRNTKALASCVRVGGKVAVCERCEYYVEMLMSALNRETVA